MCNTRQKVVPSSVYTVMHTISWNVVVCIPAISMYMLIESGCKRKETTILRVAMQPHAMTMMTVMMARECLHSGSYVLYVAKHTNYGMPGVQCSLAKSCIQITNWQKSARHARPDDVDLVCAGRVLYNILFVGFAALVVSTIDINTHMRGTRAAVATGLRR